METNSAWKYQNIALLYTCNSIVSMYCIMNILYADSYTLSFYCINGPKIGNVVFNCANPHLCMHLGHSHRQTFALEHSCTIIMASVACGMFIYIRRSSTSLKYNMLRNRTIIYCFQKLYGFMFVYIYLSI